MLRFLIFILILILLRQFGARLLHQAHQNRVRFLLHRKHLTQLGLGFFEVRLFDLLRFTILGKLGFDLIGGSFGLDCLLERWR